MNKDLEQEDEDDQCFIDFDISDDEDDDDEQIQPPVLLNLPPYNLISDDDALRLRIPNEQQLELPEGIYLYNQILKIIFDHVVANQEYYLRVEEYKQTLIKAHTERMYRFETRSLKNGSTYEIIATCTAGYTRTFYDRYINVIPDIECNDRRIIDEILDVLISRSSIYLNRRTIHSSLRSQTGLYLRRRTQSSRSSDSSCDKYPNTRYHLLMYFVGNIRNWINQGSGDVTKATRRNYSSKQ
jgi:hypothetical protein